MNWQTYGLVVFAVVLAVLAVKWWRLRAAIVSAVTATVQEQDRADVQRKAADLLRREAAKLRADLVTEQGRNETLMAEVVKCGELITQHEATIGGQANQIVDLQRDLVDLQAECNKHRRDIVYWRDQTEQARKQTPEPTVVPKRRGKTAE